MEVAAAAMKLPGPTEGRAHVLAFAMVHWTDETKLLLLDELDEVSCIKFCDMCVSCVLFGNAHGLHVASHHRP